MYLQGSKMSFKINILQIQMVHLILEDTVHTFRQLQSIAVG